MLNCLRSPPLLQGRIGRTRRCPKSSETMKPMIRRYEKALIHQRIEVWVSQLPSRCGGLVNDLQF